MTTSALKIKFGKTLKHYMQRADVKQRDIAELIGVTCSAVSQVLHGKITIKQEQLDMICDRLGLNVAHAHELSSMLTQIRTGSTMARSPFNRMVFSLRCQRNLSPIQLANLSGISSTKIEAFENNFDVIPALPDIIKIAEVLECSAEELAQSAGIRLTATGEVAPQEVRESKNQYMSEIEIPCVDLIQLDNANDRETVLSLTANKAKETIYRSDMPEHDIIAVRCSPRDLSLGMPGYLTVYLSKERPKGYKEIDFVKSKSGKFSIFEVKNGKYREYKLSGTRRYAEESDFFWAFPVVEIVVRPVGADKKAAKHVK